MMSSSHRLLLLVLLAVSCSILFLLLNHKADLWFTVQFRGKKLALLIIVAIAIAVSTVVFQAICQTTIVSPSLMGFDNLYILVQTGIVFLLGSQTFLNLPLWLTFLLNCAVMMFLAIGLFNGFIRRHQANIHLMLLVGIVLGVLFSSASQAMQRVISPTDFMVLQDAFFASFVNKPMDQLVFLGAVVVILCLRIYFSAAQLDLIALGRDKTISLGVQYETKVKELLICVSALVAVSTALVGPILFFGLLVANLTYRMFPSAGYATLIQASGLVAVSVLVLGETIVQHVFQFHTQLAIVIEFFGGLLFLYLVFSNAKPRGK